MLQTNHLSIYRKSTGQVLLRDFTFSLNADERIAVVGEEGNGKSTLLKLLSFLLRRSNQRAKSSESSDSPPRTSSAAASNLLVCSSP